MLRPRAIALGLAMACAGLACAGLAGCASAPPASYDLAPAASAPLKARAIRGQLVVAEPVAGGALDSERIVIRTGPEELAYLSGAQWTERLPRLVQSRMIETFENARMLKSVGRPGMPADHALTLDLRRFEIDVTADQAVIEIAARITSDATGRTTAAQLFTATAPAPKTADGAAAAALDQALADIMRRIVVWTGSKI